jgi:hypothetical protein
MVRAPVMTATIERRLLINYQVDPEVLTRVLPAPFRPHLVGGVGLAGICLIRLGNVHPAGGPGVGITTENAAHRIAVEWDTADGPERGVYIPRRDTSSRLTALVGGRLFPGFHGRARFEVREPDGRYHIELTALDGTTRVRVAAGLATELPAGSVFGSLAEASDFFRQGSVGWSATPWAGVYDGVELEAPGWRLEPARLDAVESSFFDDPRRFPPGTAVPDGALLMRDLPSRWRPQGRLTASSGGHGAAPAQ